MAFFGNDAVNRVNIHYGFVAFAEAMGLAFVLVFLLRSGVSVPLTLLAQAAIQAGRFALRPLILPLGRRFGLKPVLIGGVLSVSASYLALGQVHGLGWPLLAYLVISAIGALFYWTAYHAYFSALGDDEHRGHQIGVREAIGAVVGIVAPLAGALALSTVGSAWAFTVVALIQTLAALPLIGAPDVAVADEAPGAWKAARTGFVLFAIDGWFAAGYQIVWGVALFTTLDRSYGAYGGAMALAGLVGAATGMTLGRHIDGGGGRKMVLVAYLVAAGVVVMRAFSLQVPIMAVVANALGALVLALVAPVQMTPIYNLAKASPCPLRFQMASEAGWDIGCFAGCLLAAGIAAIGGSLAWAILSTLPVLVLAARILWGLYGSRNGRAA